MEEHLSIKPDIAFCSLCPENQCEWVLLVIIKFFFFLTTLYFSERCYNRQVDVNHASL